MRWSDAIGWLRRWGPTMTDHTPTEYKAEIFRLRVLLTKAQHYVNPAAELAAEIDAVLFREAAMPPKQLGVDDD